GDALRSLSDAESHASLGAKGARAKTAPISSSLVSFNDRSTAGRELGLGFPVCRETASAQTSQKSLMVNPIICTILGARIVHGKLEFLHHFADERGGRTTHDIDR